MTAPSPRRRWPLLALALAAAAGLAAVVWWAGPWSRSTNALATEARAAAAAGDHDLAEHLANELDARRRPDLGRLPRAESLLARGRAAEALRALGDANAPGPTRPDALILAGRALLELRRPEDAAGAFATARDERPDSADAHRGLAAVYYDQGALLRAVEHLKEVARLVPGDGRPHRMIAHVYRDLDDRAAAVDAYREALGRSLPEAAAAEARSELAEVLVRQGEFAAALDVIASGTVTPAGAAARAEALLGLGRAAEATAAADAALARQSRNTALLRVRGRLHLEAGEFAAAAGRLEAAVAAAPAEMSSRHLLAQAYERLDRRDDAAAQRRKVQELQDAEQELTRLNREANDRPWDAAVRERMAAVCERIGRDDLAAMWRRAARR
jgi:tetratricopeptide (TPR) repeat protein